MACAHRTSRGLLARRARSRPVLGRRRRAPQLPELHERRYGLDHQHDLDALATRVRGDGGALLQVRERRRELAERAPGPSVHPERRQARGELPGAEAAERRGGLVEAHRRRRGRRPTPRRAPPPPARRPRTRDRRSCGHRRARRWPGRAASGRSHAISAIRARASRRRMRSGDGCAGRSPSATCSRVRACSCPPSHHSWFASATVSISRSSASASCSARTSVSRAPCGSPAAACASASWRHRRSRSGRASCALGQQPQRGREVAGRRGRRGRLQIVRRGDEHVDGRAVARLRDVLDVMGPPQRRGAAGLERRGGPGVRAELPAAGRRRVHGVPEDGVAEGEPARSLGRADEAHARAARRGSAASARRASSAIAAARSRSNGSPATAAPSSSARASGVSAASSLVSAAATASGSVSSPRPPAGSAIGHAGELLEVERVAARQLVDGRGRLADELDRLGLAQGAQHERRHALLPPRRVQRRLQARRRPARPRGEGQQHRAGRRSPDEGGEGVERRRVGPLHVVEAQHERARGGLPRELVAQRTVRARGGRRRREPRPRGRPRTARTGGRPRTPTRARRGRSSPRRRPAPRARPAGGSCRSPARPRAGRRGPCCRAASAARPPAPRAPRHDPPAAQARRSRTRFSRTYGALDRWTHR